MRKIETGKEQFSPIFIMKNGSTEEEWELSAVKVDDFLEVYLHHLNTHSISPVVVEVAAINKVRDEDIIRSLSQKEFTTTQSHGWARFARFDQLADSTNGFLLDSASALRFAVRISLQPVTLQDGQRSYVTHSWEVSLDRLQSAELTSGIVSPKFSTWSGSSKEEWQLMVSKQNRFIALSLHPQRPESTLFVQFFVHNRHEDRDEFRSFQRDPQVGDAALNTEEQLLIKLDKLRDPKQGFLLDGKIKFGVRLSSDPIPLKESHAQQEIQWKHGEQPRTTEASQATPNSILSKADKTLLQLIHYGNVTVMQSPDGTFRLHASSITARNELKETIDILVGEIR